MNEELLDSLNPAQRGVVEAPLQNLLVLAGAGSGKTRVLVYRLAWVCQQYGISPFECLAVTFTNKAAAEMLHRLQKLGLTTQGIWVGTFHGIAHRFLRMHAEQAGLDTNFQVIDSDDQLRMIKRLVKSLNLDDKQWEPKSVQHYINAQKDALQRATHSEPGSYREKTMHRVYHLYEKQCREQHLVDFAELLLRMIEVLSTNDALRAHYQARFRNILVDEFQDTNESQYKLLKLLKGPNSCLMAVGDDDQSIYGWRGAKIENIQSFQSDFAPVQLIRLEQNYRSTGHILCAANAVIEKNERRLGKTLWTDQGMGEPIYVYCAFNEIDEAMFVIDRLKLMISQGRSPSDCAILYRSNAQSRVLEEALLSGGIPYRIYGGLRFFERQEIKNALAYLRLLILPEDDTAFERIVNLPARGLGDKTLEKIREHARAQGQSLWQTGKHMLAQSAFPPKAQKGLQGFFTLMESLQERLSTLSLAGQVEMVISQTGLMNAYREEGGEQAQGRMENLAELVNAAKEFEAYSAQEESKLLAFLTHAILEAGETQEKENAQAVQLMTIHASKGLEFPIVFLVGLEEQLFPTYNALNDPLKLEEERRLCYVALTRAIERCVLSYAESRRLFGQTQMARPSRFINEIPAEYKHMIRMQTHVRRPHLYGGLQKTKYSI